MWDAPFEKEEPKKKLTKVPLLVSLVLYWGLALIAIVGLILGLIGYVKSNSSNKNKKLSLIGLILSIIFL